MKKSAIVALLLLISLGSSSCVYYKGMPKEWRTQQLKAENLEAFTGHYKLSLDNASIWKGEDYNDLRFFQNTSIYGRNLVKIRNLNGINICTTNGGVNIGFLVDGTPVYENFFDKQSVEFKSGALKLNLKNQFEADGSGFVTMCNMPTIIMYKTSSDDVLVCRKETMIGTVFVVVPVITGQNYWFKLNRQASPYE